MMSKKLEKRLMYGSFILFFGFGVIGIWIERYDVLWVCTFGLLFYLAWAITETLKEAKK